MAPSWSESLVGSNLHGWQLPLLAQKCHKCHLSSWLRHIPWRSRGLSAQPKLINEKKERQRASSASLEIVQRVLLPCNTHTDNLTPPKAAAPRLVPNSLLNKKLFPLPFTCQHLWSICFPAAAERSGTCFSQPMKRHRILKLNASTVWRFN